VPFSDEVLAATHETNLPGVRAYRSLPDHLGPTSTDEELARYGVLPRPDRRSSLSAHQHWEELVENARHRIIPELVVTDRRHGPADILRATPRGTLVLGLVRAEYFLATTC
jgi:hypothetical protein